MDEAKNGGARMRRKYIVILGDGMSDYDDAQKNTPLKAANKPVIDRLCALGQLGRAQTVPAGMKPGSDNANLSCMGYDAKRVYTGRSPLEAVSMGVALKNTDVTFRTNLVTLSEGGAYREKTMLDYSAGEITTAEAAELIGAVQRSLGGGFTFYSGVSYRHLCLAENGITGNTLTPPHDISDKAITPYLPSGQYAERFLRLMEESFKLLSAHPVNLSRKARGLNPANSIWMWGEGVKPELQSFKELYGLKGAVISAVDLIRGIGILAGLTVYPVEGATGNIHTDFEGKADACLKALGDGNDFVYLHVEAPDECGHRGERENKIKSIEYLDSRLIKRVIDGLDSRGLDYSVMILPDHATPLALKTHVSDPVPFIIYRSYAQINSGFKTYNEDTAAASGVYLKSGPELMRYFLEK